MKQMVVTGLSNEQDFTSGESVFILILNREIRVPVSEEIANKIIEQMYHQEEVAPYETPTRTESAQNSEEDDWDDQV